MANVKLPKQWGDWCRAARLKPAGKGRKQRGKYKYFYLVGRGRVWRVNMYAAFECGDTYEAFDRWALCDIRRVDILPKTKAEFVAVVRQLLEEHKVPR